MKPVRGKRPEPPLKIFRGTQQKQEVRLMLIEFKNQIVALLAELLKRPKETFDIDTPWDELGIDSVLGLRLVGRLSDLLGEELDHILMLDCSCIRELAAQLADSGIMADEAYGNQEWQAQYVEAT
jgi:acyl carrier protein